MMRQTRIQTSFIVTASWRNYGAAERNVHDCSVSCSMSMTARRERIEALRKLGVVARRRRRADYQIAETELLHEYREPEEIVLVGVSHSGSESCNIVRDVILEYSPDAVVVELCRSRSNLLYSNENDN